ncbi:large conductance mechanosensitive channel protein MscL [Algibacter luteus]|uniref:Large-conductance mechanosensitive channel n=1 Tax=Algibacter luteus TaxID=1178825 RepID=A0A1M6DHH5_9FLAO|nr:large conductance mechanosensitive channel protein MscL [Algibacter luteus]SHI72553.1 large conductance mechanosensitive channel [Algibacter luteus]
MLKEFKDFIMTGNVVEFAVAVIMAGAIGAVVKGFVDNIVMPVVGHFSGGMDFAQLKIVLDEAIVNAEGAITTPENAIMWGSWVNTIVNLIIVGLVMFLIVKAYNKTKKPVEEAPAEPAGPSQEDLLAEIRDLLKK